MVLKTGEITVSGKGSDITLYTQHPINTLSYDFEGQDIPVEIEPTAILSPYGLDALCNSMSLYHPPINTSGEPFLKASLYLRGAWEQKEAFKGEMRLLDVTVTEEPDPYDRSVTILSVVGAEAIFHFGRTLRDEFALVHLEVHDLPRQLINPELIGLLLEDVDDHVQNAPSHVGNPFHEGAYRHDWMA